MEQLVKKNHKKRLIGLTKLQVKIITLVVIIALCEILPSIGLISSIKLPRPSSLLSTFWELVTVGYPKGITIWLHIKATIWRILQGYILATIFAIPLGLFIGNYYLLERAANPIITFARSLATISLLPLAIAWFGIGETSRVLLIMYGSFWAIITNTIQGVKSVDITFIHVGRMFGANRGTIFFRVVLPATLPRIFAGMKIGLGVAFMVIIAVEMIGTVKGLGALIQQSRFFYNSKIAIDGMIIIGIFGLIISIGLDWLEKIMLPWSVGLEEVKR